MTGQPFWWGNWLHKAYKAWQKGKVSWHASIYNFFHRCHDEKSSISASWVGGISSHYYYTYTLLYKLLGEIWLHAWYTFMHHTITLSHVTSLTMHGNWILRLLKQSSVAQCLNISRWALLSWWWPQVCTMLTDTSWSLSKELSYTFKVFTCAGFKIV